MAILFLLIGVGAGLDYGLLRSWQRPSWERTLTKTSAMVAILIWATLIGAPNHVIIAICFAVLGDFGSSRGALNWVVMSAITFGAVHAIYMVEYLALANRSIIEAGPAILLATCTTGVVIIMCLRSQQRHWHICVLQSTVGLLQFALGQMVGGEMMIISYTTSLFFAAGLFHCLTVIFLEQTAPMRRLICPMVWCMYMMAQIFTIIGLTEFA
ncbi:hypothetical protein SAMN06273572_11088 [Monaibacterium marinum]|uniref:YhhN-like protein n=1 Tax=Pontivivens marinum TaxID=1690039 RepID=A0A2C9CW21_9RHOB|nr:hypothetical protein [Monaibacterium marinum]SOH95413.1 hypothetical protein SAMN06273572_11088 [Monaibacterium marinum]